MISTFDLRQFRGIQHVRFEKLGRANLIVGGNNVGKTSILEALMLMHGESSQLQALPNIFRELPRQGHDSGPGFWRFLVRGMDIGGFRIEADTEVVRGEEDNSLWRFKKAMPSAKREFAIIGFDKAGNAAVQNALTSQKLAVLSTKQASPEAVSELFNQIAPLHPENETKLEDLLRQSIEPRLRRLRYAKPQGTHTHLVYVDLGDGPMLPFTQLGQAFSRSLQVYCEIFASRPDILLIDEIENGLYYEGLEDYWRGLMAVLEDQGVQLFATTHSRECMEAAHRAAGAMDGDPLRFLRLDRRVDDPTRIVATSFGKQEMATAIEFNREMR